MSSADAVPVNPADAGVPAVTVLMPVYNAGLLLGEAVGSILAQTFTDFEFLIIDDGSTDGAVEALRGIGDARLRIVRNPRNLGLIATLNRGIELARAPLLARMDADDVSLPERLQRQVATFAQRPHLALLGTWARFIDKDGRVSGAAKTPTEQAEIVRTVLRVNTFVHPSIMARTQVLRDLGGYPADAPHAEDYALWLKIVVSHETANLPEYLLHYRVHAGQVSQHKILVQRNIATKLARAAGLEFAKRGLLPANQQPPAPTLWARLTGKEGTLGGDYYYWSRLYRILGDRPAATQSAWRGLKVAPFSIELWRSLTPTLAGSRNWLRHLAGK